jgi:pimeloyl-ACP methyl ester carboxylesterase
LASTPCWGAGALDDLPKLGTTHGPRAVTDERRRIPTGVGTLVVRVLGEGPPAVLWHSLFVDERSWQRVEEGLAGDRRLVIITGPGHGASTDPGHRYSLDDCAAAAGEVLATLGIDEPVDWVGNAWGGHVGIVFAATWPARCRTLVTLGTPIQAYTRSEQLLFRVLLAVYRVAGMISYLSSGIMEALLSPRTRADDPEAVALVLDCLRAMERPALANAMRSISLGRPNLTPRLGAIRCPTLFVTGSDHSGWTPAQADAKCRLLAHGSVAVVPDTAYLTPLEAPAETVRLVRDHWVASQA